MPGYFDLLFGQQARTDAFESAARLVNRSLIEQYAQAQTRYGQETIADQAKIGQLHSLLVGARSEAAVSAAMGGVAGNSVAAMNSQFDREYLNSQMAIQQSMDWRATQFDLDTRQLQWQAYTRLREAAGPAEPRWYSLTGLMSMLGIAGQGAKSVQGITSLFGAGPAGLAPVGAAGATGAGIGAIGAGVGTAGAAAAGGGATAGAGAGAALGLLAI